MSTGLMLDSQEDFYEADKFPVLLRKEYRSERKHKPGINPLDLKFITFQKKKIAKERKVIPDPIDDRKFQE